MKEVLKYFCFRLLDLTRLPGVLLFLSRNRPLIILYHGVSPEVKNYGIFNYRKKFLDPVSFRKQLVWIKKRFRVVPLSYIIERLKSGNGFEKNVCAITFDDGYQNLYKYAFPVLKELGLTATIFITTNLVDKKEPLWVDRLEYSIGTTELSKFTIELGENRKTFQIPQDRFNIDSYLRSYLKKIPNPEATKLLGSIVNLTGRDLRKDFLSSPYRGLDWEETKEMSAYGIDFGPHTLSHPILSKLNKETAEKEIYASRQIIQARLGKSLNIFAYPNGERNDFNEETVSILKNLGFNGALTTIPGRVAPGSDPYQLPRITLDGTDTMSYFRIIISGVRNLIRSCINFFK